MEALTEAGGSSSESTEVWLANLFNERIEEETFERINVAHSHLLNVFVLSLTEMA